MEGIVNVLKPPGMTSSNAVADIRHIFSEKRVGHTGTLDPGAAGVLPVCLGKATRLFDYLMDKRKEYIAEVCFGAATDTQDSYGSTIQTSDAVVSIEQLSSVLPEFVGTITQIAPNYSAVRIDGRKMYELAREGREIIEKKRDITVFALELLGVIAKNRFLLRIECSKGTYVRTLCHDIGTRLDVPSHMSFLLRSASGEFRVENAYSIVELEKLRDTGHLDDAIIPIDVVLHNLPEIRLHDLSERKKRLLTNGAEIKAADYLIEEQGLGIRTYIDDEFIGIGKFRADMLHIDTYFMSGGNDE